MSVAAIPDWVVILIKSAILLLVVVTTFAYAMLAERLLPWLGQLSEHVFVISHGGVARVLMALIAGVTQEKALRAPIIQGRAIVFENGGCQWIG